MIDTLLSSALNDSKINHEEFANIINEKNIYENIKENIKDTAELNSLERTTESSSTHDRVKFFRTYRRKINNIIKII